jgi:hypothetical protein
MKRAKLSLDPARPVRRQPPSGFTAASEGERSRAAQPQTPGAPRQPSPGPVGEPGAAAASSSGPRPRPAHAGQAARSAPRASPASALRGLDRAKLLKGLLAIGLAAASIVLLKRRLF